MASGGQDSADSTMSQIMFALHGKERPPSGFNLANDTRSLHSPHDLNHLLRSGVPRPQTTLCELLRHHIRRKCSHPRRQTADTYIPRQSGHRAKRKEVCSTFLRFFVWIISLSLFAMNLIVNFEWIREVDRTRSQGYVYLMILRIPSNLTYRSLYDIYGNLSTFFILSAGPPLVLFAFSLYIGLQLWKYGTHYSFLIHATYFNPWIWMVVGSLALLTGNLMPADVFPLTSNAGELIIMICIIRMFREIHHDLWQGSQMQQFIDPTYPSGNVAADGRSNKASSSGASVEHNTSSAYSEISTPTMDNIDAKDTKIASPVEVHVAIGSENDVP